MHPRFDHRLLQQRPRGAWPEPVGASARQQFVQHDPECVDVTGDLGRLAQQQLRTGVLRRQHLAIDLGELRVRLVFGQKLCDSEVQQASLARFGHQYVRGLYIPVQHPALVGVLNGVQHLQKEA